MKKEKLYTKKEVEEILENQFLAISKAIYIDKIPLSEFDFLDWNKKL